MKIIKVYTMGGDDMMWRRQIEEICLQNGNTLSFIHPPLYKAGLEDKEFVEWNKQQIFNSDIVVMNIEEIDNNILYEIGIIDAINTFSNKHIFVIGIGEMNVELKPHIKSTIFHYEPNYEDAIDYILSFLSI